MEAIKKQNIASALRAYCGRYESQARAAHSLKGVSASTVSQMLNGNWELIRDDMWRNVAAQVGSRKNAGKPSRRATTAAWRPCSTT